MMHQIRFPGESEEYRKARDELLRSEIELRARLTSIAEQRRTLPAGGAVETDYLFEEWRPAGDPRSVRLSELFGPGKTSLIVYSYMFGPEMQSPCASCTSLVDGFNASAEHVADRIDFVVVGKSPIARLGEVAEARGWDRVRLLSSHATSYNEDYHAEDADGRQLPIMNVFTKRNGEIRHFYATELLFADVDGHPRHVDLVWPLWNLFDLTPEGRGTDWHPRLAY